MHKLCNYIDDELMELEDKIEKSGKLSLSEVEYGKDLAKFKSALLTNKAMEDEYGEYSHDYDGMDGRSMTRRNFGDTYYNRGMSNARGRTGNVRRDSMGRYSRDEAEDEMMEAMEDYLKVATDPAKKAEIERFMKKMGR
ncbi:MAG: hypothetical protein IJ740_08325 [Ruminococcus sp.]|nr:hypothetical protein [Ruminococcus sp.]